jgi:hypothetical protein
MARHSALENAVIRLIYKHGQTTAGSPKLGQLRQKDSRSGKLLCRAQWWREFFPIARDISLKCSKRDH